MKSLIDKYNVAVPRYTSYPTVPQWEASTFTESMWLQRLEHELKTSSASGISLYIHLPYCESLCTYCGCNTRITVNHNVERPYIDAVLKEWEQYVALAGGRIPVAEIHLGGGTPTFFAPKNLEYLLNGILKTANLVTAAEMAFEGHPNNTTDLHLQTLFDIGFRRVSYGVQDVNEKVQVAINRIQPVENVKRGIEKARSIGYSSVNVDLVYGLPFQDMQGLQNTVKTIGELKPDRIAYYSYAHVPWKKAGQRKFTEADLPAAEVKLQMFEWAYQYFLAQGYVSIGMDHFALEQDDLSKALRAGSLHRNFMGYTPRHTRMLLGLGVSSISDCWTAFAQNPVVVEEYLDKINKGMHPVQRGHLLTPEDERIRKTILQIICLNETVIPYALHADTLQRLQPLIEDGLITLEGQKITVTSTGRRFVRNICFAFDQRHFAADSKGQQYSKAV